MIIDFGEMGKKSILMTDHLQRNRGATKKS